MIRMGAKRSRELKPLSSEHEQALLVAFQLRKGLAGHGDSAGAPKDLPGLLALAKRYDAHVFSTHTRAEEELLGRYLSAGNMERLRGEHDEMRRLLEVARADEGELRSALARFADLLERHVRWEERELFPAVEAAVGEEALAVLGHELEKRLVIAQTELKAQRRA